MGEKSYLKKSPNMEGFYNITNDKIWWKMTFDIYRDIESASIERRDMMMIWKWKF